MRVGLFGGTFDPPHNGHLAVALETVERFQLDSLLLAPTARQPLKSSAPNAQFADRLAMVRMLCKGHSALEASSLDGPRDDGSSNYTIDAIRALRAHLHDGDSIFVVVGADAFLDLQRWREPKALLAEAEWIVVSRPGFRLNDVDGMGLSSEQRVRVHLFADVHVDVSATELRRKLREGESVVGLVPETVLQYIRRHKLYLSA